MVEADLAVVGIAELATPEGRSARTGSDLGRLRVVRDGAAAARDGRFVFAGPEEEFRRTVRLVEGARIVDARGGTVVPGFVDAHWISLMMASQSSAPWGDSIRYRSIAPHL